MRIVPVILLASAALLAQPPATRLTCDPLPSDTACLILEAPVPFAGLLAAGTGGNGGISVQSWDGPGVWARWQTRATAETTAAAWTLIPQIRVDISDGQVQATGPAHLRGRSWSVTYEIFVPAQADLSLETLNGAIDLSGVQGKLRFTTVNGAIGLRQIGGDVTGATVNGALTVVLSGDGWEGAGLSVQTVNGAVSLAVPSIYAAHIQMGNRIGQVETNLPVTITKVGLLGHRIDNGGDGAPVRLSTVNGALALKELP
jgi:hypothetical protein